MEKTELNEILNALKLHSEHVDKKLDAFKNQMNEWFEQVDKRFDRLEKKVDGIRVDLTDTQETTNFLSRKYAYHERKLQNLINQQS